MEQSDTRARTLRELLSQPDPAVFLEAHDALSAVLVEEAGVQGIWASSLTLSSAAGVRDNSELTMTEVLGTLENMSARVRIPILFDGDTGYGSFHHFQLLVKRLERRGIAGVCIEDKCFPKQNSFLRPTEQRLEDVDTFCGKLRAGKDARENPDFVIVARTEALVTGRGLDEALLRGRAYVDAGADAILVHSRAKSLEPIRDFMAAWDRPVPIICVPTTYASTPPAAFASAGVSLVIWANHMLRAGVVAMQRTARHVANTGTVAGLETDLASLGELFRLQKAAELMEAERYYGTPASLTGSPKTKMPRDTDTDVVIALPVRRSS